MTVGRIPSVEGGIQPTLLTAKGDLISATAASTVARLAVGSDAQILVADSTASTGLKWATPTAASFVGCLAHSLTLQSIANATYTAVALPDADVYDTNTFHDTATNNSRITIPSGQGGYYFVWGVVAFKDNATGERQVALYKNGTILTAVNGMGALSTGNAGGGNPAASYFSTVINLAAADYLQVFARQYSGGALNLEYANFGCQKVG